MTSPLRVAPVDGYVASLLGSELQAWLEANSAWALDAGRLAWPYAFLTG